MEKMGLLWIISGLFVGDTNFVVFVSSVRTVEMYEGEVF